MLPLVSLAIFALLSLLCMGFFIYWGVKIFRRAPRPLKILIGVLGLPLLGFAVGWWLPIGQLEGDWELQTGFRANPRHIAPAPQAIQFLADGLGTKTNPQGQPQDITWQMVTRTYGGEEVLELDISGRWHSYWVRVWGFGTRMSIQATLRGEATMGRFDTASSFTATYRRPRPDAVFSRQTILPGAPARGVAPITKRRLKCIRLY